MLHKNKITLEKHVLFTYICCRKSLGQLQYHNIIWISSSFTQGIRHSTDIATIRVSFCNKYMYKTQHIFHVRFYVDAAQQSFLQSKSINLKTRTWMSINLKTIHIWCGLTLYQTLSWMQTVSQWLIFTVWMLWCTFYGRQIFIHLNYTWLVVLLYKIRHLISLFQFQPSFHHIQCKLCNGRFPLPIRSTRSSDRGLVKLTIGVVRVVCLAQHRSGFLPENFGHVRNIRIEIEKPSTQEAIRNWLGIDWVEVELIGKRIFTIV